ncbi:MAG: VWA domain-containing protein [Acidobacteriota bacterium]
MRSPRRRWLPIIATGLLFLTAAFGQDLTSRRGFKVKLTTPVSGEALIGETVLKAEVSARAESDVERVDFYLDDALLFSDSEPPYQVVHDFGRKPAAHVIKVIAVHKQGLSVSDFVVTRALDFADVVDVQRVLLNVSVRDGRNAFVGDLTEKDFEVTEDGTIQKIVSVTRETRPILAGILIDSSGSMLEQMLDAQTAACRFVDALTDADQAFVIDFDEQVTLRQAATSDRKELCVSIKGTRAVGGTSLYDAVHAAFRVIRKLPYDRAAFIILSDGDDTESKVTLDRIIDEAKRNEVSIYAIALGAGVGGTGRSALSHLAEDTGGRAYFVSKVEELAETYEAIAAELRGLYQLVYTSSHIAPDGKFRRIGVKIVRDGKFDVRHRSGYFATTEP